MSDLLRLDAVERHFDLGGGLAELFGQRRILHAVDGVSLSIGPGETFGIAGESGCGKSTLARLICRLDRPTGGSITFDGQDLGKLNRNEVRALYREIQMVFQDPMASLNPRKTVGRIISRPLRRQLGLTGTPLRNRVLAAVSEVDLNPAEDYIQRYPHELSGGEKQRVVIARAVALRPKLVVADEPVTSLDMSVRGKVLALMSDLQARHGLSYLFITHDLRVLRIMSSRAAIMYLGQVMETGPTAELFARRYHPYTKALFSAEMVPDPRAVRRTRGRLIEGEVASALNPKDACRFRERCPWRRPRCDAETPKIDAAAPGHGVACHFWREIAAGTANSTIKETT
ncbi:ABC transporter ATP-binding protein [Silicimonas algicola]|uniref:Peptide/nickel transport system ATP-binding protein/oligopeptide transport system ATP-binding protein n=1 Tax=Silicimonas algicola TaxID=1826607 RepID=A0A316FVU8_9RHOB|nr:ABC transporter ATP-binding protein [Silicimonas algicola]AZQ68307.1 ABC transporter ATP-binding protein [Silicimonas algicola]PWK52719.1 peptide/nickel transport system ATP-binding protein/oligopeptide transport system ATP-binding protein [Silicimonas algicola]